MLNNIVDAYASELRETFMQTKSLVRLGSIFIGIGAGVLAFLILREKYDYQIFYKLGTIEEPPTQEEIAEFENALKDAYSNPKCAVITHTRVSIEKHRKQYG